jgi:hypothetical protein
MFKEHCRKNNILISSLYILQNKKIFSFLKNKNGGRKRSHFVQERSDWIQNAMLGGMSRAVTK